jgi:segregation and condensation protein B
MTEASDTMRGNGLAVDERSAGNGAGGTLSQALGDAIAARPASLPALIEGVLFVSDGPVGVTSLAKALDASRSQVEAALSELAVTYDQRGVRLQRTNGHVQLVSAPEAADVIQRYLGLERSSRLSRAALETLSIVAYRQPVTRPEIDELRGVNSEGVLRTVIARGLVEPVGRRLTVGHPIEYGTTFQFLEYFGLGSLDELPPIELFEEPPAGNGAATGVSETSADDRPNGGNGAAPGAPQDA